MWLDFFIQIICLWPKCMKTWIPFQDLGMDPCSPYLTITNWNPFGQSVNGVHINLFDNCFLSPSSSFPPVAKLQSFNGNLLLVQLCLLNWIKLSSFYDWPIMILIVLGLYLSNAYKRRPFYTILFIIGPANLSTNREEVDGKEFDGDFRWHPVHSAILQVMRLWLISC